MQIYDIALETQTPLNCVINLYGIDSVSWSGNWEAAFSQNPTDNPDGYMYIKGDEKREIIGPGVLTTTYKDGSTLTIPGVSQYQWYQIQNDGIKAIIDDPLLQPIFQDKRD